MSSRSTAKRYCARSFEPTLKKSTSRAIARRERTAEGISSITPTWIAASCATLSAARRPFTFSTRARSSRASSGVPTIGNITFTGPMAAARRIALSWRSTTSACSAYIRIAR